MTSGDKEILTWRPELSTGLQKITIRKQEMGSWSLEIESVYRENGTLPSE